MPLLAVGLPPCGIPSLKEVVPGFYESKIPWATVSWYKVI